MTLANIFKTTKQIKMETKNMAAYHTYVGSP